MRSDRGLALLLALLLPGCLDPIPPGFLEAASVTPVGMVREACPPRVGLDEVSITAEPSSKEASTRYVNSEKTGEYRLPLLPGLWTLLATKRGYLPAHESLLVGGGPEQVADLYLAKDPRTGAPDQDPPPQQIDLLLVIDNSPGMAAHQHNLSRSLPSLLRGLFHGLLGNLFEKTLTIYLRIGVTSTDLGAGPYESCLSPGHEGLLTFAVEEPGCTPPPEKYVAWELSWDRGDLGWKEAPHQPSPGAAAPPIDDQLRAAAACLVHLGERGCGFEQPLEAARKALDPLRNSFRRDNAALVVLIFTDEDDCSAQSTELFAPETGDMTRAFNLSCFRRAVSCTPAGAQTGPLQGCRINDDPSGPLQRIESLATGLKAQQGRQPFFLGVIAGDPGPVEIVDGKKLRSVCADPGRYAAPGIRLRAMVDRLTPFASFGSICGDLDTILLNLGRRAAQSTALWPCARP